MSDMITFITGVIDDLSGYFLDHCPDDQLWEDFDPERDAVRTLLQDAYEQLVAGSKAPQGFTE